MMEDVVQILKLQMEKMLNACLVGQSFVAQSGGIVDGQATIVTVTNASITETPSQKVFFKLNE